MPFQARAIANVQFCPSIERFARETAKLCRERSYPVMHNHLLNSLCRLLDSLEGHAQVAHASVAMPDDRGSIDASGRHPKGDTAMFCDNTPVKPAPPTHGCSLLFNGYHSTTAFQHSK